MEFQISTYSHMESIAISWAQLGSFGLTCIFVLEHHPTIMPFLCPTDSNQLQGNDKKLGPSTRQAKNTIFVTDDRHWPRNLEVSPRTSNSKRGISKLITSHFAFTAPCSLAPKHPHGVCTALSRCLPLYTSWNRMGPMCNLAATVPSLSGRPPSSSQD